MIIDKHKAIFVHIPKNAGTSVENFFSQGWEDTLHVQTARHDTIHRIKSKFPKVYNSHDKFAIIRNPYDRMVSWYFYIKKNVLTNVEFPGVVISSDTVERLQLQVGARGESPCYRGPSGKHFPINYNVIEFKEWIRDPLQLWHIDDPHCLLEPQHTWVDETVKIIKYENLYKELNEFFKKEIYLPVANKTEHDHYLNYYDQKSLNIVYDRYKEDFEKFNYKKL